MIKLPDFILIPYQLLEDEEISLIDERLYGIIYWLTKLKNEKCTASNITLADLVKTSPQTISNSLVKLDEKKYIQRIFKDKNKRHRKEIIPLVVFSRITPTDVSNRPDTPIDVSDTPSSVSVDTPTDEQNKNIYNKNNKQYTEPEGSGEVVELIKAFEEINPACKRMYGNTTQRRACTDLIQSYGFERVKNVISSTLPRTNKISYMPTITTPNQLFEKWSSLEAGIIKLNDKKQSKGGIADINKQNI